mgnify:CR=1 FL=1
MGLFDILKLKKHNTDIWGILKPEKYDMDTLEGINAIPVPAKNYHTGDYTKDCIYYLLQRKATEHKRAKRMDCAIACLRKSNELSDYEERPLLLEKEYLRLVKYIELTGNHDLAQQELAKIYQRHPEFKDARISNLVRIKNAISKNKKQNNDYVFITTSKRCPICSKYDSKVFSISGKSKKYPKLPLEISKKGGFCPNCILGISTYFDGINTPPKAQTRYRKK